MIPFPMFQGRQRLHPFFKRADTTVVRAGRKKMKKKKLFPQFVVARLETKFPHGEHSPHFLTSHNYIHQHSLLYHFEILENEMTIWLRAPETTGWSLLKKMTMKQQKTEYGESSSKQGGATEGKKEKKNVQRLAGFEPSTSGVLLRRWVFYHCATITAKHQVS